MKSGGKIGVHIIGGLGDVSLTRICKIICTKNLKDRFYVASISDIYEDSLAGNRKRVGEIFDSASERLVGNFDEKVKRVLFKGLVSGEIEYHRLDKDNPVLDERFFAEVRDDDVIDIALPNLFHVLVLKQVLNANKHVIVEKPLACSAEQIDELARFMSNGYGHVKNKRMVKDAEHYSHYPQIRHFIDNLSEYQRKFGKIKGIELLIQESEGFDKGRNRDIVEVAKSGGGAWLDMGIHAIAFLRQIGAIIDRDSAIVDFAKDSSLSKEGNKYGETRADVKLKVSGEPFVERCPVKISVGKAIPGAKKEYTVRYQGGKVKIGIKDKSLMAYRGRYKVVEHVSFDKDPFYVIFEDAERCIRGGGTPFTSLESAMENSRDVFEVYKAAGMACRGNGSCKFIYDESGFSSGAGVGAGR